MADTYSPFSEYAKYLKDKCDSHDHDHGCGCKDNKDCGCCPVGTIAIEDKDGKHIGCLTPNDAEIFMTKTFRCPDGYIRVVDEVTGVFIACLTPDEYVIYKSI